MGKQNPIEELEALFPENRFSLRSGRSLAVEEFAVEDWAKVIKLLSKHGDFFEAIANNKNLTPYLMADDGALLNELLDFIPRACPELDRESASKLKGSEAIALIFKIIQVNRDFLALALAEGAVLLTGTSSADLSPTDTDSVKSDDTASDK